MSFKADCYDCGILRFFENGDQAVDFAKEHNRREHEIADCFEMLVYNCKTGEEIS
jgi:hypothetical protein